MNEDKLVLEFILSDEEETKDEKQEQVRDDEEEGKEEEDTHSELEEHTSSDVALFNTKEVEDEDYFFIEERDVTLQKGVFNQLAAEDKVGDIQQLPIKQSGTLIDFVLIAEDSNFSVKVEIDEHDIIDDTYTYISDVSTELSKVGAYKDNDGNYVVHVTDYDFRERCNVLIRPENENTTFKLIRLEAEQ